MTNPETQPQNGSNNATTETVTNEVLAKQLADLQAKLDALEIANKKTVEERDALVQTLVTSLPKKEDNTTKNMSYKEKREHLRKELKELRKGR